MKLSKDLIPILMSRLNRGESLPDDVINKIFNSLNFEDKSKHLISGKALQDLISGPSKISSEHLDKALSSLTDIQRDRMIDNLLGINGGKYDENKKVKHLDELGYDNWKHGDKYNPAKSEVLAKSKFLSPRQIEHIKRHGNMDEKFALFNNKHISHKHANEMYSKWLANHEKHGYSLSDFINKLKQENPFSKVAKDYYRNTRKEIEDKYPLKSFMKKNMSDEELAGTTRDEYVKEQLKNLFSWLHERDDGSSVDCSEDKEAHPDYYSRSFDTSKKWDEVIHALKKHPPDHAYQKYDDYIKNHLLTSIIEKYENDSQAPHLIQHFLPRHLILEPSGHPNETDGIFTKSEDLNKAEKLKKDVQNKIAETLYVLNENKEVLNEIKESSPDAYEAIKVLIQSLIEIAKQYTGVDPKVWVQKLHIQDELDGSQGGDEGGGGTAEAAHQQRQKFAPGAVRQYPNGVMMEKQADGTWKKLSSGGKTYAKGGSTAPEAAPQEGQEGSGE